MKAKILSLSLILFAIATVNAQVYVDGTSGKVGVGAGFTETTPPVKDLQVNGVVKADTFILSDGTKLSNNGLSTNQSGEIQTDNKLIINNDLQVINKIKVGTNSLYIGGADQGTGANNTIYSDNGNLLIQGNTLNVGIGYSDAEANNVSQKLDVKGNINLTGDLYKNGQQVLLNSHDNSTVDPARNSFVEASHTADMMGGRTYEGDNAVDGDPETKWMSLPPPTTNESLIINLKTVHTVSEVRLATYPNDGHFGDNIVVSYSIDKNTWTQAGSVSGTQMNDATVTINPPVTALFIKIELSQTSLSELFSVSEILMKATVATPELAIWEKQRNADNTFSDNIVYNKGNVTIGKNMGFSGWDNTQNMWVPKTLTMNWRGSILFSRMYLQEPMVEGTVWARGLISQNLKWDETLGKYKTIGGATYPDFAAMVFENLGDIGFFTRNQFDQNPALELTKDDMESFRRMTITKEGDVKITNKLYFGNGAVLDGVSLNTIKASSNFWSTSNGGVDIHTNGNVGIGMSTLSPFKLAVSGTSYFQNGIAIRTNTICPNYLLQVNGFIGATEINVKTTWCDYVFKPEYKLRTLQEVEQFINENSHLPDVPSEAEVNSNGINVGEINSILLKKIEELTLYVIQQQKEIDELKNSK